MIPDRYEIRSNSLGESCIFDLKTQDFIMLGRHAPPEQCAILNRHYREWLESRKLDRLLAA